MADEVRPLAELRDSGLLWLINSVVLHPRGFAIGLNFDCDGRVDGWILIGDGSEPWHFEDSPEDHDAFRRAERTLRPGGSSRSPGSDRRQAAPRASDGDATSAGRLGDHVLWRSVAEMAPAIDHDEPGIGPQPVQDEGVVDG